MTAAKTPIALIVSTGQQDLKFWGPDPDRDEFPKDICRALHEALYQRTWRVLLSLDGVQVTPTTLKDAFPGDLWQEPAEAATFVKGNGSGKRSGPNLGVLGQRRLYLDEEGRVLLRPAKIERLLARLKVSADLEVQRVLVFYSNRQRPAAQDDVEQFYLKEPTQTGAILADWLSRADTLNLTRIGDAAEFAGAEPGIRTINYLQGQDCLEGPPGGEDHPITRRAVRCIDDAIRNLAQGFAGRAIVSSLGGMGQVKPVILASAEVHFRRRVFDYWETQGQAGAGTVPAQALNLADIERDQVMAAERLTARAHALMRLEEGDVLGGWGSAAHLATLKTDRAWLDRIKELAAFFRGEGASPHLATVLSGGGDPLDAGVETLLLRGFQVEAALQGQREEDRRIPEALVATTAFADLALERAILAAAPAAIPELDRDRLRVPKSSVEAVRTRLACATKLGEPWQGRTNCKEGPFPRLFAADGRLNTVGCAAAAWRDWLRVCRQPGPVALGVALEDLETFLESSRLRYYRNLLAHRSLGPGDPQAAVQAASRSYADRRLGPLWNLGASQAAPGLGDIFLASPLVAPIFGALGAADPAGRYRAALGKVIQTLLGSVEAGDA